MSEKKLFTDEELQTMGKRTLDLLLEKMTFNREDFPAYCAHCYFQNISTIEPDGKPLFEAQPPEDLGKTPRKIYIYI